MKVTLGGVKVTGEDDGSFSLTASHKLYDPLVLSLEVYHSPTKINDLGQTQKAQKTQQSGNSLCPRRSDILWNIGASVSSTVLHKREIRVSRSCPSFSQTLTIGIGHPRKTCNLLPLPFQVSKRLSSWYQTIWRQILPNPSSKVHPSSAFPPVSHEETRRPSGFLPPPSELIQLYGQWEEPYRLSIQIS